MISKKLLGNVLGEKINSFHVEECHTRNGIRLNIHAKGQSHGYGDTEYTFDINVDTLAYNCKEWARKKGYEIISTSHFDIKHCNVRDFNKYWFTAYINYSLTAGVKENIFLNEFSAEKEYEAIFKACDWLLEKKD